MEMRRRQHACFGTCQVEEMALQNITLRRSDGLRIFYPIVKLCTEPVFNVTRSNNRWEGFKARVLHRAL